MTADGTPTAPRAGEITTAAELDALPVGSVVLSEHCWPSQKVDTWAGIAWSLVGDPRPRQHPPLPAAVLFRPDSPQPDMTDDWDAWAERVAEQIPEDYQDGEENRDIIERGIARLLIEIGRHWDEGFAAGQHIANQTGAGEAVDREVIRAEVSRGLDALDGDPLIDAVTDLILAARGDAAPTEVEWGVRWPSGAAVPRREANARREAASSVSGGTLVQRTVSAWREVRP